ncbi:hypothetical protein FRC12_002652 [Ceratobasidium sp. 428]|nr:hypothetical protein FRC12_002652 [Ceratobasidium sp. 428]
MDRCKGDRLYVGVNDDCLSLLLPVDQAHNMYQKPLVQESKFENEDPGPKEKNNKQQHMHRKTRNKVSNASNHHHRTTTAPRLVKKAASDCRDKNHENRSIPRNHHSALK